MQSTRSFAVTAALFVIALTAAAGKPASAAVDISVSFGPPALPVYEQPMCPGEGYLWVPGYWAWADDIDDYYWVPGTWVLAPQPGYLWTPGYWEWRDSRYFYHEGYWGPHVGFYGGIDYGYGYNGRGYEGGYWNGGRFFYNRSVTRVNETVIHNVYEKRVIVNNVTVNRVSFNGGNGGVPARPSNDELRFEHERHLPPIAQQTRHVQFARGDVQLRAASNQGRPPIAATEKPGDFKGHHVIAASQAGAPFHREPPRASGMPRENGPSRENGPPRDNAPPPEHGPSRDNTHSPANEAARSDDHARLDRAAEHQREAQQAQAANEQRRRQMEAEHERQAHEMAQHREQPEKQRAEQKRRNPHDDHGDAQPRR